MSVRESYRILNCIEYDEYEKLSKNQKEWFMIFISSNFLNLDEGSFPHKMLWDMFPEGTKTGDRIRDYQNGLVDGPLIPNPE